MLVYPLFGLYIISFNLLREKKVLDKNNIPYQQYVDLEYFRVLKQKYSVPSGETKINIKTMVFQKEIDFIMRKIREHGYYVDTVGRNKKIIEEYIKNQIQEDIAYEQLSLKEYIDPFTGEPVKVNKK